jgi:transposase
LAWFCGLCLSCGLGGGGGEGDVVAEFFELIDEESASSFWLVVACVVVGAVTIGSAVGSKESPTRSMPKLPPVLLWPRDMVAVPKSGTGSVEAIRALHVPRNSAMKARTQVANQVHTLIDTAPDQLREQLIGRKIPVLVTEMARWRPGTPLDPTSAHRYSLHMLARRWLALTDELDDLDQRLAELVNETALELVAVHGVGVETAVTLLIAAGDNPERLAHERSFAALCGVSPVDRSSGRQRNHSLNRGGNRDANRALWRIALVRMATDPATRASVERRTTDGKSKKAIIGCLKRYIAREIYPILQQTT